MILEEVSADFGGVYRSKKAGKSSFWNLALSGEFGPVWDRVKTVRHAFGVKSQAKACTFVWLGRVFSAIITKNKILEEIGAVLGET